MQDRSKIEVKSKQMVETKEEERGRKKCRKDVVREIIHETLVYSSFRCITNASHSFFFFFFETTPIYSLYTGIKEECTYAQLSIAILLFDQRRMAEYQVKRIDDESSFSRARLLDPQISMRFPSIKNSIDFSIRLAFVRLNGKEDEKEIGEGGVCKWGRAV